MTKGEASSQGADLRRIGHVDVEVETREGAIARLCAAIRERHPGAWGFCNAHTVNLAAKAPQFRRALQAMTLFNDGVGVDLASRWLYGTTFPENLNGTDLFPLLLHRLPAGTSIFLLGGKQDVVADASASLAKAYPNIRIAGAHHGYFSTAEGEIVASKIAAAAPHLVVIGMGQPKQENWAAQYGRHLPAPTLCVGALIDRQAGRVPRAPLWMRKLRAEWLFRLILEPRRLAKRYLWGNLVFLVRIGRQRRALLTGGFRAHA